MMGEGNKLCIRAEPLAKGRFLTTAGKHRREAAVNIWERGGRRGKLRGGGGCQDNRSGPGGRACSAQGAIASEAPSFSSTEPPLATTAADHRLPPITTGSPGPAGKQQARHGRKGGQEKRPAARRTTAPRNTHKHLISDGDRRCAKAAAACRQAQVEWSCQGGKMRGGGGCQDNRARQEREVRSALACRI